MVKIDMADGAAGWRQSAGRACAVAAAGAAMCWPALCAGYPFFIADSVVYAHLGRPVIEMLRSTAFPREDVRSPLYAAAIYLLHRNLTPWPVVALNALLTSWTVWLVVRSVVRRRPAAVFLLLVAALSVLSTVSWYVCSFMPDILGAVLYLALYLLVFARETLRRWEAVALFVLVWWTAGAHMTYPVLAAGLCVFLGMLWRLRWVPLRGRGRALLQAAAVVGLGVASLLAANLRLFGRPSLAGPQPPYLMARVIADGASHRFLQENCQRLRWTLCGAVDRLPWDSDTFLWDPVGVYQGATPAQREQLHREEWPLVLGTLRTHPLEQAQASWRNFVWELTHFGVDDRAPNADWLPGHLEAEFPGSRARFLRSRPREDGLFRPFLRAVQQTVGGLAAAAALGLLAWLWPRRAGVLAGRVLGLAAIVVFIVVANAALTGVLSSSSVRYEGRVMWLLPMLACLLGHVAWQPPEASG